MKKSDIEKLYECQTGQTYKHEPLYVGDVYKNNFGTMGIVLAREIDEGKIQYYYKKTNMCEHVLPQDKAGMANSEFVANVVQDDNLMQEFIKQGIIIDDSNETKETETMAKTEKPVEAEKPTITPPPVMEQPKQAAEVKEEKPVKAKKKSATAEPSKAEVEKPIDTKKMNIFEKINAIRIEWSKTDVEKAGKGRAGGGAKYDYYKPQQIIDFCLAQEVKHRLYSKFSVIEDRCYYEVTDLDNLEMTECVSCPFDIPRKMAASEAQQVGAAMTYHNRRLAMMMYKIEDNSKESVDVLEDADYTEPLHIPTPPIVPPAPVIAQAPAQPQAKIVMPPAPKADVQPEAVSEPVNESKVDNKQSIDLPWKDEKETNLAGENDQKDETKEEPKKVEPPKNVFGKEITPEPPKTVTPPPAKVEPPKVNENVPPPPPAASVPPTTTPAAESPAPTSKKSIESLY